MKELITAISLLYSIPVCRIVPLKDEKVFLIQTKTDRFVLKLLSFPAMETGFITDAMTYLSQKGFHRFNEVVPTTEGKPTGKYKDCFTLLTKELHGRVPSYKKTDDMIAVTACLADLHHAARYFIPIHRYEERIKWGTMTDTIDQGRKDLILFRQRLTDKKKKSDFDTAFLEYCDFFIDESEQASASLKIFYPRLCEEMTGFGGFCHHDPAHHNFLIDRQGKAAVFDFDYAIADLRAHDVASFLLKILKTNHWDIEPALIALHTYETLFPLSSMEKEFIYRLLTYPYDFHHAAYARYEENNFTRRIEKKLFRLIREKELRENLLKKIRPFLSEEL
ncbi:MAG: CotS family spore coat protein [Clostridia bacterium]